MEKNSKSKKIIIPIILVISAIMIVGACYVWINFPYTYFEEIVFYCRMGLEDSDNSVFFEAVKIGLPFVILIYTIFYTILYDITFGKKTLKTKKGKQIYPFKVMDKHRNIFVVLIFIISLIIVLSSIKIFNYLFYIGSNSTFIKENYVNPEKTDIKFNEKRNLIFIVVESLETSFFSKEHNGYWDYEVTPELYKLLNDKDSITFYNNNKKEGLNMIQGASWTTASVVSTTTGVPFKIRINKNGYHSKDFMDGAYALGDLLKDNGYYNEVISSAKTSFGGLKEYFKKHGDYSIVDAKSLDKYGLKMKKSDKGKWGFNDNYLFETAKKRLEVISKQDEPFNLELITIDTHFTDGFIGNYSETKYKTQYENVYATESRLIYDFVNWVKQQDFYDNTTIVIVGDHISMQTAFFRKRGAKDRYVYNCIINPAVKTNRNKNRIITALDIYPTTVSAIGGIIDGDRLGLGSNLFSNKKTLAEEYGVKYLDKELQKRSDFYNNSIVNDEYLNKFKLEESR